MPVLVRGGGASVPVWPMNDSLLDGRYRLMSPLAEGGMSVVWRGHDEVLARPVAVKVIKAEPGSDNKFAGRVRREARALARISHRHIANVYDFGDSEGDGAPYLVMELVVGETLGDVLRRGPVTPAAAIEIAAQVAGALAAAHAAGVVHCDVTPGNVMLSGDGVKIIDFGIASTAGEQAEGVVFGTPAYLAPERKSGGRAHAASDVYGLGLLLYEMLAGHLPWPDGTAHEVVAAHRTVPPEPLPEVPGLPDRVRDLCLGCLAIDPAQRPSSRELSVSLAAISRVASPMRSRRNLTATVGSNAVPAAAGPPAAISPAGMLSAASGSRAESGSGASVRYSAGAAGVPNGMAVGDARRAGVNGSAVHARGVDPMWVPQASPNGGQFAAPDVPRNGGPTAASGPGQVRNRTRVMPHGVTSLPDTGRVTEPLDDPPEPPRRRRSFFALPSILLIALVVCLGLNEAAASRARLSAPAPTIRPLQPGAGTPPQSSDGTAPPAGDGASAQPSAAPADAPRVTAPCHVEYNITQQWAVGFVAQMTITNLSEVPIAGWTVTFSLHRGQHVGGGWNGEWAQHGSRVTVRNVGFNDDVPPGGAVTLGFIGVLNHGHAAPPTQFALNGDACV